MNFEEEMQDSKGVNDGPGPCRNCGHDSPHTKHGCEHEPGDSWVIGNQPSQPTILMALPPCGCKTYEPMSYEDVVNSMWPEEA